VAEQRREGKVVSQITSPKVHWTRVGYSAATQGLDVEKLYTSDSKVNGWISEGHRRGARRIKKLQKMTLGEDCSDPKVMALTDPVLVVSAMFNGSSKLYLYRQWTPTEDGKSGKAILYSNSYMKTHAYLRFLVNEARRVTPDIDEAEVEHHIINNNTHKGMMTCEWKCPKQPKGYDRISQFPTAF
jgi:hypothetical protein